MKCLRKWLLIWAIGGGCSWHRTMAYDYGGGRRECSVVADLTLFLSSFPSPALAADVRLVCRLQPWSKICACRRTGVTLGRSGGDDERSHPIFMAMPPSMNRSFPSPGNQLGLPTRQVIEEKKISQFH